METKIRVFRRNDNNIILVWEKKSLSVNDIQVVYVDDGNSKRPVSYKPFAPYENKKDKFKEEVEGIIINHQQNNLKKETNYPIRVCFTKPYPVDFDIEVFGIQEEQSIPEADGLKLMGYSTKEGKWQPISVVSTREGNALLIKNTKNQ